MREIVTAPLALSKEKPLLNFAMKTKTSLRHER
jgi:hypothetical protein